MIRKNEEEEFEEVGKEEINIGKEYKRVEGRRTMDLYYSSMGRTAGGAEEEHMREPRSDRYRSKGRIKVMTKEKWKKSGKCYRR